VQGSASERTQQVKTGQSKQQTDGGHTTEGEQ
jgi:hypothetical protein